MVGGHVAGDDEEPGREAREVPAVTLARDPGLLERQRRQVLGHRAVPHPITEEVVDARKLVRVERVPVRLPGRIQGPEPAEHRITDGHQDECTRAGTGYHAGFRDGPSPLEWGLPLSGAGGP